MILRTPESTRTNTLFPYPTLFQSLGILCAAVSTEFENVPADSLHSLAQATRTCPGGDAVAVVQDRMAEKAFILRSGVPVAPYAEVRATGDLEQAPAELRSEEHTSELQSLMRISYAF